MAREAISEQTPIRLTLGVLPGIRANKQNRTAILCLVGRCTNRCAIFACIKMVVKDSEFFLPFNLLAWVKGCLELRLIHKSSTPLGICLIRTALLVQISTTRWLLYICNEPEFLINNLTTTHYHFRLVFLGYMFTF